MRFPRTLAAVAAALTLTLTACGSGGAESDDTAFNDADVDFAGDMIQHHSQALQMVDLTMGRELSPETSELTEQIRAAQAPEIERMADWLEDWGEPVPATSRDHANAHADEHGGGTEMDADMPGMMSAEEMAALESASDADFEDLWLQMMIDHHEGAVEMAQLEIDEGQNTKAVGLAEDIVAAQEQEISTMQDLLER